MAICRLNGTVVPSNIPPTPQTLRRPSTDERIAKALERIAAALEASRAPTGGTQDG